MKKLTAFAMMTAGVLLTACSSNLSDYEGNNYVTCPVEYPSENSEAGDKFEEIKENPFVRTYRQPVSTFSVDADGAAYTYMRRYINEKYEVPENSVRIEEYLNYFPFDYKAPEGDDAVAINGEFSACPWNTRHKLLRLGIKGKEISEKEYPKARFVFLVDVSGSMDGRDRLDLLKRGMKELLYKLKIDDEIAIITYSGEVEKLLPLTPVSEAAKIAKAIDNLHASGCTNGGKALEMAYQEALEHYDANCNNRIIIGTDGDFNVGTTSTSALTEMVESYAKKGIYLSCLGFGIGNYNDAMMESISNHGNGTYHFIDNENEMMKVFVHDRAQFLSVANDAKCQISFDSTLVKSYRLIGYENRVMDNKDFTDDKKDAGEIGAGQTITALYELETSDDFDKATDKTFATFDFRYKKKLNSESVPLKLELKTNQGKAVVPSANFQLAAGVAAFGMILRNSSYKGEATIKMARDLVGASISYDPHGYRAELLKLIDLYKK